MKKLLLLLAFLALPAQAQFGGLYSKSASSGAGDGSITVGAAISGSCTSGYLLYNNAGVIGCLQSATVVGTPAAGDLSYWTSSSAQALLTAASGSTGAYLRSAGTGAAPIWSTLILPNAASAGTLLVAATADTVTASATPTLGASGTLGSITMGNATSGTVKIQPVTGALGTTTLTLPPAAGTGRLTQVVFENSASRDFANVATGSCDEIIVAATGTLTTDNVDITFLDDLTTKTGWNGAGTMVTFYKRPYADNVSLKACNYTGGADINPAAVTINIKVFR